MIETMEDIFNSDDLGLLNTEDEANIFRFHHTPTHNTQKKADFVARREAMSEEEFKKYESLFQDIHKDIKSKKKVLRDIDTYENSIKEKSFYVLGGVLLYVESMKLEKKDKFIDGRTRTIFENGTCSNILFRSLGKELKKNGKMLVLSSH